MTRLEGRQRLGASSTGWGGGAGGIQLVTRPPDVRPGQAHRNLPSHTGCQLGILHKFIPGFGFGT